MATPTRERERTPARPMKAMVDTSYGPPEVRHLAEVPLPTPQNPEVLIRCRIRVSLEWSGSSSSKV
jgi:hypothetical protein